MILDCFEGSVIFEIDNTTDSDELEQTPADQSDPGDPPEFVYLKKYYLLERLRSLKSRIEDHNVTNDELDTILQFGNELTYTTLVRLADNIMDILKVQLSQISKEVKTNDKQKEDAV